MALHVSHLCTDCNEMTIGVGHVPLALVYASSSSRVSALQRYLRSPASVRFCSAFLTPPPLPRSLLSTTLHMTHQHQHGSCTDTLGLSQGRHSRRLPVSALCCLCSVRSASMQRQIMQRARGCAVAAVLLCSMLMFASGVAASEAGEWGTCGGLHGPTGKDAPGAACPSGYSCVRQDEYYWQCKENNSIPGWQLAAVQAAPSSGGQPGQVQPEPQPIIPPGAKVVDQWGQCGGINGGQGGQDAQWPGVVCPQGFECTRQDQ